MSNYSVTAPVSTAVEQYYLPQGQIHLNLHQQLQLQLQLQQEQFQHIQQHQIQEVQTHLLQGHSRTSVRSIKAQADGGLALAHCSLQEITQVYADKPDLLQLVLDAKVAEDNRAYEVERRIAEKLTLESKLLDLEILREQRRIGAGYATTIADGSYPSRDVMDAYGTLPGPISGSIAHSKFSTSVGTSHLGVFGGRADPHLQKTVAQTAAPLKTRLSINSTLANRASSQPLRTPRQFPSPPKKRGCSQLDSSSDNGQEPIYQESTAKKRGRSLSHAEVMEALRNKIRAKKLGGEAVVMVSDNAPEKSAKI